MVSVFTVPWPCTGLSLCSPVHGSGSQSALYVRQLTSFHCPRCTPERTETPPLSDLLGLTHLGRRWLRNGFYPFPWQCPPLRTLASVSFLGALSASAWAQPLQVLIWTVVGAESSLSLPHFIINCSTVRIPKDSFPPRLAGGIFLRSEEILTKYIILTNLLQVLSVLYIINVDSTRYVYILGS